MKQFILFILIAAAIVFGVVYSVDYFDQNGGVKPTEQALFFGDNSLERAVSEKQAPVSPPPPLRVSPGSGVVPSVTQDAE